LSSVYFIRCGTAGDIKIGVTAGDVQDRVRALQTGASEPLTVLAVVDGDVTLERALQARFADLKKTGEWFAPGAYLLGYIAGVVDEQRRLKFAGVERARRGHRAHSQTPAARNAPRHVEVAHAREGSASVLAAIAIAEEKDAAE
jgi:hypothetical protein